MIILKIIIFYYNITIAFLTYKIYGKIRHKILEIIIKLIKKGILKKYS